MGVATDDTRTKVMWNSPDDPNIQVILSDQGATYSSLGMQFSNDELHKYGSSAVSKLGNGDLVAVYPRYSSSTSDYELMARIFDPSTGATRGEELTLASPSDGGFHYVEIIPTGLSDFYVQFKHGIDYDTPYHAIDQDGQTAELFGLQPDPMDLGRLLWRSSEDPGVSVVISEPQDWCYDTGEYSFLMSFSRAHEGWVCGKTG